jgi:hypothetical protein
MEYGSVLYYYNTLHSVLTLYWCTALALLLAKIVFPAFDTYSAYGMHTATLNTGIFTRKTSFLIFYLTAVCLSIFCLLSDFLSLSPWDTLALMSPPLFLWRTFIEGNSPLQWFPNANELLSHPVRLALVMYTVHVTRRAYETTCVHRFSLSERVHGFNFLGGLSFYVSATLTVAYADVHYETGLPLVLNLVIILMYIISSYRQNQCHHTLAHLRPEGMNLSSTNRHYRLPLSPAFQIIACPHYFFEIAIFVCICCLKLDINMALCLLFVAMNLIHRGSQVRLYYCSHFLNSVVPLDSVIPRSPLRLFYLITDYKHLKHDHSAVL